MISYGRVQHDFDWYPRLSEDRSSSKARSLWPALGNQHAEVLVIHIERGRKIRVPVLHWKEVVGDTCIISTWFQDNFRAEADFTTSALIAFMPRSECSFIRSHLEQIPIGLRNEHPGKEPTERVQHISLVALTSTAKKCARVKYESASAIA